MRAFLKVGGMGMAAAALLGWGCKEETADVADAGGAPAKAQAKVQPLEVVPRDALALLRVKDLPAFRAKAEASAAVKAAGRLSAAAGSSAGGVSSDPAAAMLRAAFSRWEGILSQHVRGESVVAVLRVRAEKGYRPIPEIAWVSQVGGDARKAAEDVLVLAKRAQARVPVLKIVPGLHKGSSYHRLEDSEVSFTFGVVKGLLVVASSEAAFKEIADCREPVANHPGYKGVEARLGKDADAVGYLSLKAVREAAGVYLPILRRDREMRTWGFSDIEAAGYGFSWEPEGRCRELLYLHMPAGRKGMFQWMPVAEGEAPPEDLRLVPQDAIGCGAGRSSPQRMWDGWLAAVRENDPAAYNAGVLPFLRAQQQAMEMDFRDFIGSSTGEGVFYDRGMGMGASNGAMQAVWRVTYIERLKDEVVFRRGIEQLLSLLVTVPGIKVTQQDAGGGGMIFGCEFAQSPASFHFAVARGRFIFSTDPEEIRGVLSRIDEPAGGSIMDSAAYRAVMDRMHVKGASFAFYDLERIYGQVAAAAGLAAGLAPPHVGAVLSALPSAEEVQGKIGGMGFAVGFEEKGVVCETYGAVPVFGLLGGGIAGGAALGPAFRSSVDDEE